MPAGLQELRARLDDLAANMQFVKTSATLRPRLGEVLNWEAQGEALEIGRSFIGQRAARAEDIYGALLVTLLGAFERYLRQLVEGLIERATTGVAKFDDISLGLAQRNVAMTGRLLSNITSPPDHISVDYQALVENLVTCKNGSVAFKLNAIAFSAAIQGSGPAVVERALGGFDVMNCWDVVGRHATLQKTLGLRKTRETGIAAKERLRELSRWRNNLAHGGDEATVVSAADIEAAVTFVGALSEALDSVM